MAILYVLAQTVNLFLGVISIAMLLRCILSWFIPEDSNLFTVTIVFITEIFIFPIRLFLSRFRFVNEFPLDISFLVAVLFMMLLRAALPVPTL